MTEDDKKVIDLHIAEYNALTTRATYFTNIQSILLTVFIAWVVVMGNLWDLKSENIVSWGLILGAQLIAFINANFTDGYYTIVAYIENDLKPKIRELIKKDDFWGYEPYLVKKRSKKYKNKAMVGFEFSVVTLSLFVIIINAAYRFPNKDQWDWIGCILNFTLLIFIFLKTYNTVKVRLRNWK